MVIEALELDGATVLFLAGELEGPSGLHARQIVSDLITGGRRSLVLDLSGIERIYAAGISMLLDLQQQAAHLGARLVCCGARPFIREILRVTMADRLLRLQTDVDGALDILRTAS